MSVSYLSQFEGPVCNVGTIIRANFKMSIVVTCRHLTFDHYQISFIGCKRNEKNVDFNSSTLHSIERRDSLEENMYCS